MHRRLAALEARCKGGTPRVEIWINEGERHVRSHGEGDDA
jgi:hypothetical protein